MYRVYINHYKSGNSIVNSEALMFQVPGAMGSFPVQKPMVKQTEDSADGFSFTMESNSPYYDALLPLMTTLRVEYESDIIFWGRVLSVSTSSVYHTKNIVCEGTFAYFNDTVYEGVPEKLRKEISVDTYYDRILDNHNSKVSADKRIYRGTTGVSLTTATDKYEPTGWTETSSLISNLASNHGGHMKIRYSGSTAYLDWYRYYARDLGSGRPKVQIGRNILDFSSEMSPDNIFTRVIPIGDQDKDGQPIYVDGVEFTDRYGETHTWPTSNIDGKEIPVNTIYDLFDGLDDDFRSAADFLYCEDRYGIIYKTMSFSDCDTKEKLWNTATKWIRDSFFAMAPSFTIKAIDMHILDPSAPRIILGDCVDVTYLINQNGSPQWVTKKLVCKSVQYDLFNPENNSYTFGIPADLLEHNRSNKKKSSGKAASDIAASKSYGGTGVKDEPNTSWYGIYRMIGTSNRNPEYEGTAAAESFYANGELSGQVTVWDPEEDGHPDPFPGDNRDKWFKARLVGKITLPGKSTKWVAISSERGIFAFVKVGSEASPITWWYTKQRGLSYEASETVFSASFEKLLEIVLQDTSEYGGQAVVNSLRANGEQGGTVTVSDSTVGPAGGATFQASVVGKFTTGGTIYYLATSSEYGIFCFRAYPNTSVKQPTYWYMHVKGTVYTGASSVEQSSFDKIVTLVRMDTSAYGGDSIANSLRANGEIGGTISNMQDPQSGNAFTAKLVGKFNGNGGIHYVAISSEFGVFCYRNGSKYVAHWYSKGKDGQYNSINGLVTESATGDVYGTNDGTPEGTPTVIIKPQAIPQTDLGQDSQGQIILGYDLTSQEDTWKIGLNVPIKYRDASGVEHIVDGFVSASDFAVESIPSFKTKLGIFDTVIAGKVDAVEINADIAYIRKLSGNSIQAGTSVRTATLFAQTSYLGNNAYAANFQIGDGESAGASLNGSFNSATGNVSSRQLQLHFQRVDSNVPDHDLNINLPIPEYNSATGTIYASNFVIGNSEGSGGNLIGCFNGARFEADPNADGKIHLILTRIGVSGSAGELDINFNIADTQFYRDAVSAVRFASFSQTIGSNKISVNALNNSGTVLGTIEYGIMGGNPGITWSGDVATVPIKVNINGGETVYDTGQRITVDASGHGFASFAQTIGSNAIAVRALNSSGGVVGRVTYNVMGGNPGITWDGNTATVPVKVTINGGETVYDTGRRIDVDASGRYSAGYSAGYGQASDDWTAFSLHYQGGSTPYFWTGDVNGDMNARFYMSDIQNITNAIISCDGVYEATGTGSGTSAGTISLRKITGDYGYVNFRINCLGQTKLYYARVVS